MTVEVENREDSAWIWLARPEKHNALRGEDWDALTEAARAVAGDGAVRAVVLAAQGKTFCAGGDLAWMRAQMGMDRDTRIAQSRKIADALAALADLPQPLIGRLHGNAFGGGVGLAAVCDVTLGVAGLRMAMTETSLGLIPANIGPYVVARMGHVRAREVFMSARVFDGVEAQRLGLLTRVVEDLDAAVEAELAPYRRCAPGAVADAKALLRQLGGAVDPVAVDGAIAALADRWETDEAAAGIAAFFDKRPAPWIKG